MRITVKSFYKKDQAKTGSLIASLNICIDDIGLNISNIRLMESKSSGCFFAMPSESYVDKDQKRCWKDICYFPTKELQKSFQAEMHEALARYEKENAVKKTEETQTFLSGSSSNDDELPF